MKIVFIKILIHNYKGAWLGNSPIVAQWEVFVNKFNKTSYNEMMPN